MNSVKFTISAMILSTAIASAADAQLSPVFQDDSYQFTGVAVSKSGRLFVTYPRWEPPYHDQVIEFFNGRKHSFPDGQWNTWTKGEIATNKWVCAQAVWVDDEDNLWVVDPAAPEMKSVEGEGAKLVRFDLKSNRLVRIYNLTSVVGKESYLNDVRVETKHKTAYITESKNGGIVVLNTDTGDARLVLSKHYSVKSDPNHKFRVNGRELLREGKPMRINSDGIALSPDGQWLYYKPLTDKKIHRVRTEDLRNTALNDTELGKRVNDLGAKFTTSDGMIFDKNGNLYLSDIENNAIVRVAHQTKKVDTLIQDQRLLWPDSFAWGQDGSLYVTCSQIQNMAASNNGKSIRNSPYMIFKIKLAEGFAKVD